jgi:6-phosphogluconolactonase
MPAAVALTCGYNGPVRRCATVRAPALLLCSVLLAGVLTGCSGPILHPDKQPDVLFAAQQGAITAYAVRPGALDPLASASVPGNDVIAIASHDLVYAVSSETGVIATFDFDQRAGSLALLSSHVSQFTPRAAAAVRTGSGDVLYVANLEGSISAYRVDVGSGALTEIAGSPFAAGIGATALAVVRIESTGKSFLYSADSLANSISAFAIDRDTGALRRVPGAPFSGGIRPSELSVASSATASFLYVANNASNNISAFAIDPRTGALTRVPGSPFSAGSRPASLAMLTTPGGAHSVVVVNAGSNDASLFRVDDASGALSPLTAMAVATVKAPAEVVAAGTEFFVANRSGDVIAYALSGTAVTLLNAAPLHLGKGAVLAARLAPPSQSAP